MHIKHIRCSNFSAILLVVSCVITSKITRTCQYLSTQQKIKRVSKGVTLYACPKCVTVCCSLHLHFLHSERPRRVIGSQSSSRQTAVYHRLGRIARTTRNAVYCYRRSSAAISNTIFTSSFTLLHWHERSVQYDYAKR